ncbi:MAG: hypothetical protein K5799_09200 [Erythrobacter sp.]|nr:hypothetical protein [Erythrobacter sp.]
MPATVATSQGLSASQPSLASASDAPASKGRPSVTVASGATEWIEWTVRDSGTALLTFIPRSSGHGFAVALDGVAQDFAKAIPAGTGESNRRQAQLLDVMQGQTIRLTVTANGAACTLEPLLHLIPEAGPWDAHLLIGPSLLQDGYQSSAYESSIRAVFPNRDPVAFNYARTGYTIAQIDGIVPQALAHFGQAARYAWCGGLLANDIANDAPDAAKISSRAASMVAIVDKLEAAGLTVGMGSTRYIKYSGDAAPAIQTTGTRLYDLAITFPFIRDRLPQLWQADIARPRYDEYLLSLNSRDLHSDYIHGSSAQYALERIAIAETWHRFLYTGGWSYTSQIERIVAEAEAGATSEANAAPRYEEGDYAVIGLADGSARDAFRARLDAVYPTVLFHEAKRLIAVAEASKAPADKTTAQEALHAAHASGYNGQTAPNTLADQQVRIDAIVAAAFDQTVQVIFGTSTPSLANWNGFALGAIASPTSYPLVDSQGAASGVSFVVENLPSCSNFTGGPATGSGIAEFPDPILRNSLVTSSGNMNAKLTGLLPGRVYDIVAIATGNNQYRRRTALVVNGVNRGERDDRHLLDNPWRVANIAADSNGEIDLDFNRGAGSSYIYPVGFVLKRQAA